MSIDDVTQLLNENEASRKYSKLEAKEIYEFIKMIVEQQLEKQITKYNTSYEK